MTALRRTILAAGIVTAAVGAGQPPPDVPITIVRETVVAFDMQFTRLPQMRRLSAAALVVPDPATAATRIRVHVRVLASAAAWRVIVQDALGATVETIDSTPDLVADGDFWTKDVTGGSARLFLDTMGAHEIVDLRVDQYAYNIVPVYPQAIIGQDDLKFITDPAVPAKVRAWGPPVAEVRYMAADAEDVCTGSLVGADLLLTNEHCINSPRDVRSAIVEFGYDSAGANVDRFSLVRIESKDFGLDYALVRLNAPAAGKYGRLFFGTLPSGAAPLVIVQHPAARPKQVSFFPDCAVARGSVLGRTDKLSDFSHVCDTLGGSSGAPVLDWNTGDIVGLHHFGYRPNIDLPENQAVHVQQLLQHIKSHVSSTIYREITQPRQP